jgi:hypothetical protein
MTELEQLKKLIILAADECETLARAASPSRVAYRLEDVGVALRELGSNDEGDSPLLREWIAKLSPSREQLREIARNPPKDVEVD